MPERPIYNLLFTLPEKWEELSHEEQGRIIIHYMQTEGRAKLPDLRKIVAEYTGSGDSWDDAQWMFYGEGDNNLDIEVHLNDRTGMQLDDWVGQWVSSENPGWENNDGGFGTVTFNLDPPEIELEHHERFTETKLVGNWLRFNTGEEDA